jgi:two-component system chemotaxis sensor kinase CheA
MPLTLAIIDGLVVRVGSNRFVIPTLCVTELMRLNGANISTIAEKYSILTVRDQNVPLVRLEKILGLQCNHQESEKGIIVVVQEGPHSAALSVDEVLGQQQVVIKQLGYNMEGCKGVAGGAIMPDGQIGIILDIHGIIAQSRGKG